MRQAIRQASKPNARLLIMPATTSLFFVACPLDPDLSVFGVHRALSLTDRAERASSQLFLTGNREGSSASMLRDLRSSCPTRQLLLLALSNPNSWEDWPSSFRRRLRSGS